MRYYIYNRVPELRARVAPHAPQRNIGEIILMRAAARVSGTATRTCPDSWSAAIGGQRTWRANQAARSDWVCVRGIWSGFRRLGGH